MRALIIDETAKEAIAKLIEHAEKNVFSMDDLLDIHNKELSPAGDFAEFTIDLNVGYRTVYTIEKQPVGKVRHLSVSVDTIGKMPSTHSVRAIMEEFGFKKDLLECEVWMENIAENHQAVNIVEVI